MHAASSTDLIVVAIYLTAVTAIGCLMSRRTHTSAEFMAAGGKLPGWVVGLSIVGTFVSSISFVANPGKTYAGTWVPFVFSLSLPYAALIATRYFVPFFRNCGSLSAYAHLEDRFGTWARVYAATFNILYHIGRIGMILYGVSLAVTALIGLPIETVIVGLGTLVVLYTLLGGIEAVIWTDVLQSVVLIGGMLLCVVLLVAKIPGGLPAIVEGAQTEQMNKLSLGSMAFDFSAETFWMTLVFGFFINLQNFAADQTYVQRYFAARSETDARRSVWMGALAYIPISMVLFFIGTALYVYYQQTAELPAGTAPDSVLPYFIISELPRGAAGLLIAAIMAAAMSTVDSSLNSSATLLLCDIRNRFLVRSATEPVTTAAAAKAQQTELRFLRWMTVILGMLGIAVALLLVGSHRMLDVWWKISGILSGGTLGLILLARFSRRCGVRGAATGVVCGIVCITAVTVAHWQEPPPWLEPAVRVLQPIRGVLHPLMAIVVGTLAVFFVGTIVGQFDPPRQRR